MNQKAKIVLIGAGNVATHLGLAYKSAGYEIIQVWSKTIESARRLAKQLGVVPLTDIGKLSKDADVYVIAVKDDAVSLIVKKLALKEKLIIHTSGTVPMLLLKTASKNYGVIYPLQTFSKNRKIDFSTVPLCVEANDKNTEKRVVALARAISKNVYVISSEKRKALHLAAVFACNFSNHMYAVAEKIIKKQKLPFALLIPLIEETAAKIKTGSPVKMQTGPAIRGDKVVIKEHLRMLAGDTKAKKIYELISESIKT